MANTKSAEKRIRQTEVRRNRNRAYRSRLRGAIKELRQAVSAGDQKRAQELLPQTLVLIDTTAQKQVIHRNTAARTKSRLAKAVGSLSAAQPG